MPGDPIRRRTTGRRAGRAEHLAGYLASRVMTAGGPPPPPPEEDEAVVDARARLARLNEQLRRAGGEPYIDAADAETYDLRTLESLISAVAKDLKNLAEAS